MREQAVEARAEIRVRAPDKLVGSFDGPRIEPGPVGEDDERRLRLLWKRAEPAAE